MSKFEIMDSLLTELNEEDSNLSKIENARAIVKKFSKKDCAKDFNFRSGPVIGICRSASATLNSERCFEELGLPTSFGKLWKRYSGFFSFIRDNELIIGREPDFGKMIGLLKMAYNALELEADDSEFDDINPSNWAKKEAYYRDKCEHTSSDVVHIVATDDEY